MRLKLSISFMAPETMNPCYSPKNNSRGGRCSIPAGDSFGHGQMVPRKGLEPSRPLSHWHLKPARLPIPPPGPGPVSTDRSRACQIGDCRSNKLYSAGGLAYREPAKYPPRPLEFDRQDLTRWHRIWTRWSRFSADRVLSGEAWSAPSASAITGSGLRSGGRN